MNKVKKDGSIIPVIIFKNDSGNCVKPGTWDDNGGECDGWGYVASFDCIEKEVLDPILKSGDAEINANGVVILDYSPNENINKENIKGKWSGWSSTGIAYFENEDSAVSYYLANEIAGKKTDFEIECKDGRKVFVYKLENGFIEEQENGDLNFTDQTIERIKEYYVTGE